MRVLASMTQAIICSMITPPLLFRCLTVCSRRVQARVAEFHRRNARQNEQQMKRSHRCNARQKTSPCRDSIIAMHAETN